MIDLTGFKSYGRYEDEYGTKIAERAEVLAAMDCLIHHLNNDGQFFNWEKDAIKDEHNWNLLDWDQAAGATRCKSYMELAKNMDEVEFERIVMFFATIVKSECFATEYREGAFAFGGHSNMEEDE